ncbi:hypothetical protein OKA05_04550 [Luteolibacter arcticus]|uniref:EF-hand domain-containing protein n=1 Tax=Luteolibacter arcticus TaxID=1581411 RepID=A0ABT3GDV7_9BACT|nr:hypothetical protein [Luteolibacter arcticus]MCW1921810.1 hypothetical protein [Luteolibacter arcticus]
MQKRSVTYCVAAGLMAAAGIAIWYPKAGRSSDSHAPPGTATSGHPGGKGANGAGSKDQDERNLPATPAADDLPFETDEAGIVDTAAYDTDGDGYPEIQTFVRIYGQLKTVAGKCDMLENARILEPPDDPRINALLIEEAAHSDSPEIREAARDGLLEYGGPVAHKGLQDYLLTQTNILDPSKLNETLDKLAHPTLKMLRHRMKTK